MRLTTIIKKIQKFNEDLEACYKETGERELYEIDTTIIGETRALEPAKIKQLKNGYRVDLDDFTYRLQEKTFEGEKYVTDWEGIDGLSEGLKFYRRMIKKTLQVWHSEDPDAELEKEDVPED